MRVLGIDNGLQGALALLEDGKLPRFEVMPTYALERTKRAIDVLRVVAVLKDFNPEHVFLERAHAMPGQGVTSMFSIGCGYGMMQGALAALAIGHTIVSARTWQKEMFLGVCTDNTKHAAAAVCQRLWPKLSLRATERSKKPHEGVCDALLIAEYGRRVLAGGTIKTK